MPVLSRSTNATESLVAALAPIAARQHGLITRRQFLSFGSAQQLDRWLAEARIRRVAPDVYLMAGAPITWHVRLLAHCLASGGVASHRAGGRLLGVDELRLAQPELTIPRGRNYRHEGVIVHSSSDFDLADVRLVDGIPCTSPDRTVLDMGQVWRYLRVEHVVDDLLRRGLVTWPSLMDVYAQHARKGRPGVTCLGAMIDVRCGESDQPDSKPERLLLRLLVEAALDDGVLHLEVFDDDGTFILESDVGWPREKVILFYDSKQFHLNGHAFERDPAKRRKATVRGWQVLPYTWRSLTREPWVLIDEVRQALGRS